MKKLFLFLITLSLSYLPKTNAQQLNATFSVASGNRLQMVLHEDAYFQFSQSYHFTDPNPALAVVIKNVYSSAKLNSHGTATGPGYTTTGGQSGSVTAFGTYGSSYGQFDVNTDEVIVFEAANAIANGAVLTIPAGTYLHDVNSYNSGNGGVFNAGPYTAIIPDEPFTGVAATMITPPTYSLSQGDIAFVGYNTDTPDGYSFVTLADIPAGEVIYFTDQGWHEDDSWYPSTETHLKWTAPAGGLSAGSIVSIIETSPDVLQITGGGTLGPLVTTDGFTPSSFNLSAGDAILAYQGAIGTANPSFIAGLNGDDNYAHTTGCDNPTTKWFTNTISGCTPGGAPTSPSNDITTLPDDLTNGVNAVMLNPDPVTEVDNYKYNGIFSGSQSQLLAAINDYTNWIRDDGTNQDITPSDYNGGNGFTIGGNPPTASSFASTAYENLIFTFSTSDFGYTDGDSDPLDHVLIESIPAVGTLYLDADNDDLFDGGETISMNDQISKADLDAGNLQYIQNGSTNTSFQFEVNDGSANSSGNYIATISVLPVPTVSLSVTPESKSESITTSTAVTATLSNAYGAATTVNLSFSGTAIGSGVDYSRSGTNILIPSGNTSNSISLTNVPDALYEGNESIEIDITSVSNGTESGTQQVTYTIIDDDSPPNATLEVLGNYNPITDESGGQAYIRGKIDAVAGTTVFIPLSFSGTATGGGTDYSITGNTITLSPGETMDSIRVTSQYDGIPEGDETVIIDMGTPTNAVESGTQQVTVVIKDEDGGYPEINIKGNGQNIADGANNPTVSDSTDFGSVNAASGSNTNTFIIENNGGVTLNISSITSTGANSSEFVVSNVPSSIAASSSATFDVTFDPTAVGVRTATITVNSDDSDEAVYDFSVQGTGTNVCTSVATATETMTWTGSVNSDWTNPCNWAPYGVPTATNEVIINDGPNDPLISSGTVQVGTMFVSGSGASLTINSGATLTISGSVQTLIAVSFSAVLINNGTINLTNTTASTTGADCMVVDENASAYNYGTITMTSLQNVGISSAGQLFINKSGGSISINARIGLNLGSSTNFTNESGASILGTGSQSSLINSGGAINNSGRIKLTGQIENISPAQINNNLCGTLEVTGDYFTNSGSTLNQGYLLIDGTLHSSNVSSFTNNGVLKYETLSGSVANATNPSVIVKDDPTPIFTYGGTYDGTVDGIFKTDSVTSAGTFISPNSFNPDASLPVGSQTLLAKITPNGGACSHWVPFTYNNPSPEINIRGNSVNISDGANSPSVSDSTDFGTINIASGSNTNRFTIENTGTATLNISSITSTGTNNSEFVISNVPTSIAASNSAPFDVTFDPAAVGVRTATITVNSDDADEAAYDFTVQGTGTNACTTIATATEPLTWTGAFDTAWDNACNWSPNGVPTAANDVVIPSGTPYEPFVGINTAVAYSLDINSGASLNIITNAQLTLNGAHSLGTTILNDGTLNNNGKLVLGNLNALQSDGIINTGSLNNNSGAEIEIDRTSVNAIYNFGGTVDNNGKITIGANASVGDYGILNDNVFNNNVGGQIVIDNSNTRSISNDIGTFTNAGSISLGEQGLSGAHFIYNNATFTNLAAGQIRTQASFFNISFENALNGILNNYGLLESGLPDGNNFQNAGTVNNYACGQIKLSTDLINLNGANITNQGLFVAYRQVINFGTITNESVFESSLIQAALINNTNASLLVKGTPVSHSGFRDSYASIFVYGGTFNGNILGIFQDSLALVSAGSFTAPNTFVPLSSLPQGGQTLFAKIETLGAACTYIVPFHFRYETKPVIAIQPNDLSACAGSSTILSTIAFFADTYQWQVNTGEGFVPISDNVTYSGATTSELSISDVTGLAGNLYRCFISSASGDTLTREVELLIQDDITIGNTTLFPGDNEADEFITTSGNNAFFLKVKVENDIVADSIGIILKDHLNSFPISNRFKFAIYSNSGSEAPGQLLGTSAGNSLDSSPQIIDGYNTFVLDSTIELTAGYYWLAFNFEGFTELSYNPYGPDSYTKHASINFSTPFPNSPVTQNNSGFMYHLYIKGELICGPDTPVSVAASANNVCQGNNITLTADCGTNTVKWYNVATGGTAIGSGSPLSYMPTATKTYYASCDDGNLESERVPTQEVVFNITPTLTGQSEVNPLTCGGADGSITFATNIPDGSYSISYTGTGSPKTVSVAGGSFILSGLSAGTYSNFSVTNAGCTGTDPSSFTLTDPSAPTASISGADNLTCTVTSVTRTASGGNSYSWSGPSAYSASTAKATITAAGTYTVTVTGSNGCTATASTVVTLDGTPPTPSISGTDNLTCTVTSVTRTASGGTSYSWSGPSAYSASTAQATITVAGTYTVTVTGTNGCTATATTVVTLDGTPPTPSISGMDNLNCTVTSVTRTASGGTSYSWSGPSAYSASTAQATITFAGTYTVTVTGTNGCTATATTVVTLGDTPPTPSISGTDNLTCAVTSVTRTASGGDSYSWSGPSAFSSSTAQATITSAGTYTVTVTATNGCTATATTVVTLDDTPPTPSISGTDNLTCAVTSVTRTASGGNSYSWSGPSGYSASTAEATITAAGTYTVTVTGSNGCTATATNEVFLDNNPPTATIDGTENLSCSVTSVTRTAQGGGLVTLNSVSETDLYEYTWSGGLGNTAAVNISSPGTYTVTVTTGNGCTATATTVVTLDDTPPTPSISGTDNLTCTVNTVSRTAHGGSGVDFNSSPGLSQTDPYEYAWSGGLGNTATVSISAAGTYTVTITSGNGCTATATTVVTVDETPQTIGVTSYERPSACGLNDASITFSTSLPDGGYTLGYTRNSLASSAAVTVSSGSFILSNLQPGLYSAFSVSSGLCSANSSAEVDIVSIPLNVTASNGGPYLEGETVQLTGTGGPTYNWSGPNGFSSSLQNPVVANATTADAGTYTLTVVNGACTATATTIVSIQNATPAFSYYYAFGGANPEIIAPLTQNAEFQISDRPVTVLAVPNVNVASTRLQLSSTSNLQYFEDNQAPYSLYEANNMATGDYLGTNFYTFIARGYDQPNNQGNIVLGPDVIGFWVVNGQRSINLNEPSVTALCAQGSFNVDFSTTGTFEAGNNFIVYLSDANGYFTNPTQIGSGSGNSIACSLPATITSGTGYKIKVVSTSPIVNSEISTSAFNIIGTNALLTSPNDDLISQTKDFKAVQTIEAANQISGNSQSDYRSGNSILLNPGFKADSGTVFEAKIQNVCP
ncbi:beta strand repeat-containing protein [Jiulongibacter sediminis]|uniref:Ig-like domain-containing protein n=1 Tax=Jiulongibacter sediminis TaxID=1605367 RepID=A0A0N8H9J1_9BACT|nr:choice-of-anchor D domain-containing protein [Jiulongibacter sediminis]KPM47516.1 hypothetical protein AFM12_13490 [Jiulongibacter sediminis]TBX23310.1 hypothetical protein TK44_13500 [Jiulongibacter sediminis]